MKLLCIECSASPASAAVTENGEIISSAFVNIKITHSQTLMTLVDSVLDSAFLTLSDIDGFAVSAGPGSFTGIRIGISALKGMAEAENKPCFAVSTLRAIAENITHENTIINAVMDARCNQYYNALFLRKDGKLKRLTEDRALLHDELADQLKKFCEEYGCGYITAGDGADLFASREKCVVAHESVKFQTASAVGITAYSDNIEPTDCAALTPVYLRLPQAERELKRKKEENL